ncbi:hypothetical protein [Dyella sp.]|jgi:hypothetical protein|uniref:hypothetical protein n=1 Tax=Dyella sp. TaxID=1869338 RepID=UPI002D787AAD|nr:hypothetical protein [Dyella sp.]HET6433247.1 hypothetical protein [Dyella sp.]
MTGRAAAGATAPPGASRRPLWLGLLVAPWVPALVLAAVAALDAVGRGDFTGLHGWPATFATLGLTLATCGAALLVSLPGLLWLSARGRLDAIHIFPAAVLVAGALAALAAAFGAPLSAFGDAVALACGALTGGAFCVIVRLPWRAARMR